MKKLALAIAALTLTGCTSAPLVSDAQLEQLGAINRHRLIDGCQNGDPVGQWHALGEIGKAVRTGEYTTADEAWTAAFNTCTGLTEEQRDNYWVYVKWVRLQHEQAFQGLASAEWNRRAAHRQQWAQGLQNAGRTLMEIQRTEDLNRSRQSLDDINRQLYYRNY